MGFFRAALEHKVITVPGEFFDVNPGKRRARPRLALPPATCASRSARSADVIERALGRIGELVKNPPRP